VNANANLEGSVPTSSARCAESNGGARGAARESAKDFGVINSLVLLLLLLLLGDIGIQQSSS